MSIVHKYALAGVRAGQTINLGGFQFTDGVYTHDSADQTVEHLTVYLERSFYAFPAGSQALTDAQARYEREQASGLGETSDATPVDTAASTEQPSETVKEAIGSLNHEDDSHWTGAGLPDVSAVGDLAGEKVTRGQIEAAAPGYNRAAAKAAAAI